MKDHHIGIIGNGNMGGAIHDYVQQNSVFFTTSVTDRSHPERQAEHIAEEADIIVLATKPYHVEQVAEQVHHLTEGKLLISIAAGIRTQILEQCFPNTHIVRTMPTIMAQMGRSTTGWWTNGEDRHELIEEVLETFGTQTKLAQEEDLDLFTACIGSGPAFLCRMQETLQKLIQTQEVSPDVKSAIEALWWYMHQTWEEVMEDMIPDPQERWSTVRSMFEATARMWQQGTAPEELRHRITTPGGTTAAGLACWEDGQLTERCQDMIVRIMAYGRGSMHWNLQEALLQVCRSNQEDRHRGYGFVWHQTGLGDGLKMVLRAAEERSRQLGQNVDKKWL